MFPHIFLASPKSEHEHHRSSMPPTARERSYQVISEKETYISFSIELSMEFHQFSIGFPWVFMVFHCFPRVSHGFSIGWSAARAPWTRQLHIHEVRQVRIRWQRRHLPWDGRGTDGKTWRFPWWNVVKTWWKRGEHVVKTWWTRGENVVNTWWKRGENMVKTWWKRGENVVKTWWKRGENVVKTWWKRDFPGEIWPEIWRETRPGHCWIISIWIFWAKHDETYRCLLTSVAKITRYFFGRKWPAVYQRGYRTSTEFSDHFPAGHVICFPYLWWSPHDGSFPMLRSNELPKHILVWFKSPHGQW